MNQVYIVPKKVKGQYQTLDAIILTEDDFNPTRPFFRDHPQIKPESVDKIFVKGVFEHTKILQYIVKVIDWMLSVNGVLELHYLYLTTHGKGIYVYPEDFISYTVASVFKDRINLEERSPYEYGHASVRKYRKTECSLPKNDNINSWTFGIVSDGRKNERILTVIETIRELNIPNFEILICGPAPSAVLPGYVKVIDDSSYYKDIRIPLCKKKNAIIDNASYNNLVIIHDRINFDKYWFQQVVQSGNYFDAFIPAILDEDTKTQHVIDLDSFDGPIVKYHIPIFTKRWTPTLYMDGSVIIVKTNIAKQIHLSGYLHWGEYDDIDFTRKLKDNGYIITVNHNVVVYTMTYGKQGVKSKKWYQKVIGVLFSLPGWCKWYIRERKQFLDYLKNEL